MADWIFISVKKYGCHLVKLIFHTSKILKLNRKIRYLQISTGLNK